LWQNSHVMNNSLFKNAATLSRWTARIVGTLLVSVMIIIAVGEGVPNPLSQPVRVQIGLFALALILVGILAGWRWELSGGLISLSGWGLFVLIGMTSPRGLNTFLTALALPGALLVASALLRRHHQKLQSV
jgi:hypothetical protein